MDGHGKSDRPIVPKNPANKGPNALAPAERGEGRERAKGKPDQQTSDRTQCRAKLQHALIRVRQAAETDKEAKFTALWHHVHDPERLRAAYRDVKRQAAPGMDGETWQHYGERLEENVQDLSERLRRGAYRARPVRRIYIPKPDGRQRPIGIPALEDKIVQGVAAEVMQAVYEADFKNFSYGFRPGRSQHNALDALSVGLMARKVNWVLDADIRGFFDAISHEWMVKFIEHRIADQRVVRHVKKWLKAGVLEDGKVRRVEEGTPQGGSISPLLANVYLHYAFDLWADQWRHRKASGEVIMVRYADDFIVGFEKRADAERFLAELRERLLKFNLELHPEKTRLIEFGRYAAANRQRRGEGKPETFDFLGFTHICDKTRNGRFIVLRQSRRKKIQAKLKELKLELRRRFHDPVHEVGQWLRAVLRGHYQYYGVPRNIESLQSFYHRVIWLWRRIMSRRSQRGHVTWEQMEKLVKRWLPRPRITHPYPEQRLRVKT